MCVAKALVIVNEQLLTRADILQGHERSVFLEAKIGLLGVVQVDRHVHGVHPVCWDRDVLFMVVDIAKRMQLLSHFDR
jgi:hypothetical protein